MPPRKTSRAVYKTARLNPTTSQLDKEALEIIERLEAQGWNFKQIAVDAILRAGGKTPEMFEQSGGTVAGLEKLLDQFAKEIINEVRKGGVFTGNQQDDEDEDDIEMSPFTRSFARSFIERQQRASEDD